MTSPSLRLLMQGMLIASLHVSCSGISSNARQLQASGGLAGGGQLAGTVFRATVVAAVRQPVTTAKLGLAMLWHRPRELVSANLPRAFSNTAAIAETPGSWQFEKLLDRKHFPRAEPGSLKWLVDGSQFFPELDRQIAAARKSIDLQIYIFDNDDIGVRYAEILKRRSGEVGVRVLFDDLGSSFASTAAPQTPGPPGFTPPPDMREFLKAGSKVRARRVLNPWLVADHTKLLVFDQRTAILGGMNIGREYYSEWHDLMVRVEGPVVGSLSREFRHAWRKAGPGGDFALFRKPSAFRRPQPAAGGIPLRILRTDPAEGRHEILSASLLAIRGARKRIWIENPYFAHDDLVAAVAAAARRGVDVRVILPGRGDSAIMDTANLATARELIQAGAKVFRYPNMIHLKVMICDDWASVGSANFDTLSLRINRELNLAFSHPAEIRKLEKTVFLPDFKRARKIHPAEAAPTVTSGIIEAVADQL